MTACVLNRELPDQNSPSTRMSESFAPPVLTHLSMFPGKRVPDRLLFCLTQCLPVAESTSGIHSTDEGTGRVRLKLNCKWKGREEARIQDREGKTCEEIMST